MLLQLTVRCLGLLLAVGVVSTTGANLRQRRAALFHHDEHDAASKVDASTASEPRLRAPASPAIATSEEDDTGSSHAQAADVEPSLSTSKSIYAEAEPIVVALSVGPPTHPYYSSPDAPSRHVDRNYPKWSVGLFMRDADPQGGRLPPIVAIHLCDALGSACDGNDREYATYNDVTVKFGDADAMELMQGTWPLEVSRYGTGFDAYILDGRGAAAIGPLEFYVQNEKEEDVDAFHAHGGEAARYGPNSSNGSVDGGVEKKASARTTNPLLKYNKGTKKSTERVHASVAMSTSKVNAKIQNGNGLEMSGVGASNEESSEIAEETTSASNGHIHSDKLEYEHDESITIDFSVAHAKEELDGYRLGIFMRSVHPQGGEFEPVVALPLCSSDASTNCISGGELTTGSVAFGSESVEDHWPLDLHQWGTKFDVYVLDESGHEVVGPAGFDVMMTDTY